MFKLQVRTALAAKADASPAPTSQACWRHQTGSGLPGFFLVAAMLGCAALGVTNAKAAVIKTTVNAALTDVPFQVSLGGGAATFLFTRASSGFGPATALATTGTARATTVFGNLSDFFEGALISGTGQLYSFSAFPMATLIPFSAARDFVGLSYILGSGVRYGYAEVAGSNLISYAFETTPGLGIVAGAAGSAPTNVPEPGTLALALTALVGVGMLRRRASES